MGAKNTRKSFVDLIGRSNTVLHIGDPVIVKMTGERATVIHKLTLRDILQGMSEADAAELLNRLNREYEDLDLYHRYILSIKNLISVYEQGDIGFDSLDDIRTQDDSPKVENARRAPKSGASSGG